MAQFLQIEKKFNGKYALWHTGFRPFFILAGSSAFIFMLLWGGIFYHNTPALGQMYFATGSIAWHAHEMIFGFAGAVVMGFLLTAVQNWTHLPTFNGKSLALLAFLWLVVRIFPFVPEGGDLLIYLCAFFECFLWSIFALRLTQNIQKAKQWQQMAIVGKIWLFVPAILAFYSGLLGIWHLGVVVGLYSGFYLILALILTFARRVMPMFIERGLNNGFVPAQSKAIDRWSLILFLIFSIVEVLRQTQINSTLDFCAGVLAAAQALIHFHRFSLWHHRALWRYPLLMSVFAGYFFFILAFIFTALDAFFQIGSTSLCTHTFAIGGIGLFAFGMMARISLGHTGRSVFSPPKYLSFVFYALLMTALLRVFAVLFFPLQTNTWILSAQAFWLFAALLFCVLYIPMLLLARKDGIFG